MHGVVCFRVGWEGEGEVEHFEGGGEVEPSGGKLKLPLCPPLDETVLYHAFCFLQYSIQVFKIMPIILHFIA